MSDASESMNRDFRAMLSGTCDLHMHAEPDVRARAVDDRQIAEACRDAGFRAIVLKSHDCETCCRAYLTRKMTNDFACFGAICMNRTHGDRVNPFAVEQALKLSGHLLRVVWMPTNQSAWDSRRRGLAFSGVPVTDGRGHVLPEVKRTMALCAEADIVFATGHSAPEESALLALEARRAGVKRCVITHVSSDIWRHTDDQIKACLDEGAHVEHCGVALLWGPGTGMPDFAPTRAEDMARQLMLAPERSFLSSDLGSLGMPLPPEGLIQAFRLLHEQGVPMSVLHAATHDVPAWLLGLQDDSARAGRPQGHQDAGTRAF